MWRIPLHPRTHMQLEGFSHIVIPPVSPSHTPQPKLDSKVLGCLFQHLYLAPVEAGLRPPICQYIRCSLRRSGDQGAFSWLCCNFIFNGSNSSHLQTHKGTTADVTCCCHVLSTLDACTCFHIATTPCNSSQNMRIPLKHLNVFCWGMIGKCFTTESWLGQCLRSQSSKDVWSLW